jgi:hypothetical protein
MSDHVSERRSELDSSEDTRSGPAIPAAVASTEIYEADDGVVFYDAENPLAWVQTNVSIELEAFA